MTVEPIAGPWPDEPPGDLWDDEPPVVLDEQRRGGPTVADLDPVLRHSGSQVDWADLWNDDLDQDDWLAEPFIARGRGHALWAPAKAGKSLFLLFVAAMLATGRAVLGRPAGEPVRILYLDLEMTTADLKERLSDMGFGPGSDLSALCYHSLPNLAVLDSQTGGADVLALATAHRAELVVIDTTSRVIGGKENDSDTMMAFYRWTGQPLKKAGIAYVRLDHAGKDTGQGQRGTSAKADDVDVVWRLTPKEARHFQLTATHRRMSWVPETVNLRQDADPLGYTLVDDSWPAGTKTTADLLDRLAVPLDHGKTKARATLKEAGHTASNEALNAALRWRRLNAAEGLEPTP